MKKIKISEMQASTSFKNLFTLGINENNQSVKIPLRPLFEELEQASNITKEATQLTEVLKKEVNKVEPMVKDSQLKLEKTVDEGISIFQSQRVEPKMLTKSTWDLINAKGGGSVTNNPDEEFLTSKTDENGHPVITLKDKEYMPSNHSGLGKVYLPKNIIGDKNVLTADMLKADCVNIISNDYELSQGGVEIPRNARMYFDGGKIRGGKIKGNYTLLDEKSRFVDCEMSGTWIGDMIQPETFGAVGDGVTDDTIAVKSAIRFCADNRCRLFLKNSYYITEKLTIDKNVPIFGTNSVFREYRKTGEMRYNLIAAPNLDTIIEFTGNTQSPLYSIYVDGVSFRSTWDSTTDGCERAILYSCENTGPQWPIIVKNCNFAFFGRHGHATQNAGAFVVDSKLNYCLAFVHFENNSIYNTYALFNMADNGYLNYTYHASFVRNMCQGEVGEGIGETNTHGIIIKCKGILNVIGNDFDHCTVPLKVTGDGCFLNYEGNYHEHNVNDGVFQSERLDLFRCKINYRDNSERCPINFKLSRCHIINIDTICDERNICDINDCITRISLPSRCYTPDNFIFSSCAVLNNSFTNLIGTEVFSDNAEIIDDDYNVNGICYNRHIHLLPNKSIKILLNQGTENYITVVFRPKSDVNLITLYKLPKTIACNTAYTTWKKDETYALTFRVSEKTTDVYKIFLSFDAETDVLSVVRQRNVQGNITSVTSSNYARRVNFNGIVGHVNVLSETIPAQGFDVSATYSTKLKKFIFRKSNDIKYYANADGFENRYNNTTNGVRQDTVFVFEGKEYIYNDAVKGLAPLGGGYIDVPLSGKVRPKLADMPVGGSFFDENIGKVIYKKDDTTFVDAMGNVVE